MDSSKEPRAQRAGTCIFDNKLLKTESCLPLEHLPSQRILQMLSLIPFFTVLVVCPHMKAPQAQTSLFNTETLPQMSAS